MPTLSRFPRSVRKISTADPASIRFHNVEPLFGCSINLETTSPLRKAYSHNHTEKKYRKKNMLRTRAPFKILRVRFAPSARLLCSLALLR